MATHWIITLAVVAAALGVLLFLTTQSRIVRTRNAVGEALGSVDAQLQNRHNLVPNMVAAARRFMQHEDALLTRIVELRTRAGGTYDRANPGAVAEHLAVEADLRGDMQRLVTAVEQYPDLRSADAMIRLMDSLEETEANISAARRYYNQAVTAYRNAIQTFPGYFIAPMMKAEPFPYYEAEEIARRPTDVAAALD